jgi:hypothetical protein
MFAWIGILIFANRGGTTAFKRSDAVWFSFTRLKPTKVIALPMYRLTVNLMRNNKTKIDDRYKGKKKQKVISDSLPTNHEW